ncbi:MAG: 5,10-methylenetetrahydrofolate reductase [Rhodobacterales bacterium]|nr:MAG: 5,10-methylenetetrahydrofolate reductase [Rhodobacterales bacterium]
MAVANLFQAKEPLKAFLEGVSVEVMPRTLGKIGDMKALYAPGTRVYIAHIEGTPIAEMRAAAKRLADDGFTVMPHFPARIIRDAAELEDWIRAYAEEAGVKEALVLAGGRAKPVGSFGDSMQLMQTGLFEKHGYTRLHVAGHPEGSKDIDPKGGTAGVDAALHWKQDYATQTGTDMAIVTQFAFAAKPVTDWAERLAGDGITLPIHVGIAGPAKLQTLIRFAIACGVGPSLNVLKKRATDLTKLLRPFEPTEVATALASYKAAHPESLIERLHLFPLGGIRTAANWLGDKSA